VSGVTAKARDRFTREQVVNTALLGLLLLGLPLLLASLSKTLNDGDVSWHVATGRWIVQHGQIPTTDPFSFTAFGRPWVPSEWFADLIFSGAFALSSYAGLAAVVAASLMTLNGIVFAYLRRFVGPIGLTTVIVGMNIVLSPYVTPRPHVLVWPLLAGWVVLLLEASKTSRPPRLPSVLILIAWANIHGSFVLALPIAAAIGFDTLLRAHWNGWQAWAVFILAAAAALLINANGVGGVLQPFRTENLKMLPLIQEWQPGSPSVTPQFYGILLLGLGALLLKGVKVPVGQLLLLLLMLGMAFSQLRHQSWFIVVAALLLTPHFETRNIAHPSVAPFAIAAIPALLLRAALTLTPPETPSNPWHLLAAVPQSLRDQHVFNGYSFGGPLILSGTRPYIDGRAELYGDPFVLEYSAIAGGDWGKFNEVVRRYDIRWAILSRAEQPLIRELDASQSWRLAYSTGAGAIYVRRDVGQLSSPKAHLKI